MDTTTLRVGTDELTFRVSSDALLAVEVRIPAGGGPPLLHRHDPAEVYRIERGALAIYLEEDGDVRRIPAAAGDVVHIPGGVAHTIRNESGADAEAYVVFSPGAPIERFMRAAGALADPTPADVLAVAERHGVTFGGPVPAP